METSVYKFDSRAFQWEPNASAVSLGSLAPDNLHSARRNWPELGKNEQAQSLPLREFYKGLRGKTNFGPNGVKMSEQKFDLRAFQWEPRAAAVSLGSLAPENMR